MTDQFPPIYVLRHGQTEWNAAKRHQGQQNSHLTAKGVGQAEMQGRILRRVLDDPSALDFFASPSGRAWQTAGYAVAPFGQPVRPDARLMEVNFGAWEGLTDVEVDAEFPGNRIVTDVFDWHFTSPGGERLQDLIDRTSAFLSELQRPSVIVTHGITSRVLRGVWLGLGRDGMSDMEGGQGNVFHLADGQMHNLTE